MRKATITGARLIDQSLRAGGRRTYPVMVTLTYAKADSWRSQHVRDFLHLCRKWFKRRQRAFHYSWVAELTKRGRVHFHVVVWMPKGFRLPKADKRGWWPHGMTKIEAARNPVGYIAKYVSKETLTGSFPKGLRTHGRGGLNVSSRIELRWWCSPRWVREWCISICDVMREPGGGFLSRDTGEWRPSPYEIYFSGGAIFLRAKETG